MPNLKSHTDTLTADIAVLALLILLVPVIGYLAGSPS